MRSMRIVVDSEALEGVIPPVPWWYGIAYTDWLMGRVVFLPVGLHLLGRVGRILAVRWNRWRFRRSSYDRRIAQLLRSARRSAFFNGMTQRALHLHPTSTVCDPHGHWWGWDGEHWVRLDMDQR